MLGDAFSDGLEADETPSDVPTDSVEWSLAQLRQRAEHAEMSIPRKGAQLLPFSELGPEVFERLVAEVVALRDESSVHFYGRSGQKQYGLDIYEQLRDGSRTLYQVKRHQSLTPGTIRSAVRLWAGEARSRYAHHSAAQRRFDADRFVIVASAPVDDDTATTDELATVQREYRGDVHIDVWGAEALSYRLRDRPGIVMGVFGEAWATEFCGRDALQKELKEQRRLREAEECLTEAVSTQFTQDDKIKFRQIDLVGITVDRLFVDVPVRADAGTPLEGLLRDVSRSRGVTEDDSNRPMVGAVQLLLSRKWNRSAVVVGGPGQGKSTLLQYLCQFHRARRYAPDRYAPAAIGLVDVSPTVRTPLRVDLTKYAEWRRTRLRSEPAASTKRASQKGTRPTLPTIEAYVIHLVEELGGGLRFGSRGFRHVAKTLPLLLALDGLDEIADAAERETVSDEIRATEARLRAMQSAAILVVATRPGTVGNPIWRDPSFSSLFLQRLTPALRMAYLERWLEVAGLDEDEVKDLRDAFEDGMSRPHVSELAGNPMQLAILLHLMHQVPSLPEKRTELYESYINIFMQRESKHPVIKKHRELVISFHRVLAWYIHANVELKRSTGIVTYDQLRAVLSAYLAPRGHTPEVIDDIFGSMTQRVLCLSEPQAGSGEYRFDVQPLREYFASSYLYEVAPDSSEINLRQAILQALVPRQYWSNVLRFFAGELRSGEIPNIAFALDAVAEDDVQAAHPSRRILARLLLEDHVFAGQHEVVVRNVVSKILDGPGAWLALDGLLQQDDDVIAFPPGLATDSAAAALTSAVLNPDASTGVPAAALLNKLSLAGRLAVGDIADAELRPQDKLHRLAALGVLGEDDSESAKRVDELVGSLDGGEPLLATMLRAEVKVGGPALLAHCHAELAAGRVSTIVGARMSVSSPLGRLVSAATGDRLYARLSEALAVTSGRQLSEPNRHPPGDKNGGDRRRRRTRRGRDTALLDRVERLLDLAGDWTSPAVWAESLEALQDAWGQGSWPVREAILTIPATVLPALATGAGSLSATATWSEMAAWRRRALEQRSDLAWWENQAALHPDGIAGATFVVYALATARASVVQSSAATLERLLQQTGDVTIGVTATTLNRHKLSNPAFSQLRLSEPLRLGSLKPSSELAALIWQVGDENTRDQLVKHIRQDPTRLWDGSLTTAGTALRCLTAGDSKIPWKAFRGARLVVPGGVLPSGAMGAMSRADALSVAGDPASWPTDIVRLAVDRLSRELEKLPPVAKVARRQGWTGEDGDLIAIQPPPPPAPRVSTTTSPRPDQPRVGGRPPRPALGTRNAPSRTEPGRRGPWSSTHDTD